MRSVQKYEVAEQAGNITKIVRSVVATEKAISEDGKDDDFDDTTIDDQKDKDKETNETPKTGDNLSITSNRTSPKHKKESVGITDSFCYCAPSGARF